jgi:hypothetical protein
MQRVHRDDHAQALPVDTSPHPSVAATFVAASAGAARIHAVFAAQPTRRLSVRS